MQLPGKVVDGYFRMATGAKKDSGNWIFPCETADSSLPYLTFDFDAGDGKDAWFFLPPAAFYAPHPDGNSK